MTLKTPIVLCAFGTTTRAMHTYSPIDRAVKAAFPEHPVKWAYTSNMVRARMKKTRNLNLKTPREVLEDLHGQDHDWAVVQSLHMICGHEFYRLVEAAKESPMRTSMGLPLLTALDDYRQVSAVMLQHAPSDNATATVWIGHGTDHPAWSAYPALAHLIAENRNDIFVGTVEGALEKEQTISKVICGGFKHVHLVPLMLVAGTHLQEDIAGEEDSWKSAFELRGIRVSIDSNGLGQNETVLEIIIRHIREALEIIFTDTPIRRRISSSF